MVQSQHSLLCRLFAESAASCIVQRVVEEVCAGS